jgi:hypothetical protein
LDFEFDDFKIESNNLLLNLHFRRNEEAYRNMSTRRQRRNIIRPERVKLRAKYPDQERNVFQHFVDQRQQGKFI